MFTMLREAVDAMPWLILAMSRLANAACECGYSLNKTNDANFAVFTDLIENDFLHTPTDNMTSVGWAPQQYDVDAKEARGPFGKQFLADNVEANPLKHKSDWTGESVNGGDAGFRLWVRGDHSRGMVSGAEIASSRNDTLYGSFRVGMKLSKSSGTCGAFFWFYNNSQEIDMEFLSKQFNQSQGAVNLVLQTPMSIVHGYDASGTKEFKIQPLPFRPDEKFHEYRFDWTPEKVSFLVDGAWIYDMTDMIPAEGGRLFMNHWSNGDPLWSAGPPDNDTPMVISYVKAYFNSTDIARQKDHKDRCFKFNSNKVCAIPEQNKAPDGNNAETYFFTQDNKGGNHAPNQTVFAVSNSGTGPFRSLISGFTCLPLFLALFNWTYSR